MLSLPRRGRHASDIEGVRGLGDGPLPYGSLTRVGGALGLGRLLLTLDGRVDQQRERGGSLGLHRKIETVGHLASMAQRAV